MPRRTVYIEVGVLIRASKVLSIYAARISEAKDLKPVVAKLKTIIPIITNGKYSLQRSSVSRFSALFDGQGYVEFGSKAYVEIRIHHAFESGGDDGTRVGCFEQEA